LRAFLSLNLPNWKLLIVRPQEDLTISNEILQYIKNFDNVLFHSAVFGSEKWLILSGADAYILMSDRENFGFTVVEAALAQIPVFISKGVDIYTFFESKNVKNVFDIHCETDIRQCFNSMAKASDTDLADLRLFCESESLNKILMSNKYE
jgi:glycosyltransferase involved in cell wall biosynthesis